MKTIQRDGGSELRVVEHPLFAKCMGDVKHVTLGDYLCPECVLISEDEYVKGVVATFRQSMEEAHARLQRDLAPCSRFGSPPVSLPEEPPDAKETKP